MREPASPNPYEVSCARCRVTFPVGTRVCLHCGQPIGRPAVVLRPAGPEEILEQDLPARPLAFSPMTLVWVLAAVATVIYRACT
jgi:hypothetical protein